MTKLQMCKLKRYYNQTYPGGLEAFINDSACVSFQHTGEVAKWIRRMAHYSHIIIDLSKARGTLSFTWTELSEVAQ